MRFNWIGSAVLTAVFCSVIGTMLLFAGAAEMESSKSVDWAVVAGYLLLLPVMLVGYAAEYASVLDPGPGIVGWLVMVVIQVPWYVFLFWVIRKAWRLAYPAR